MPSPYPLDLPVAGDAGLLGNGYGMTVEADLTEAEFVRAAAATQVFPRITTTGEASVARSSGVMALGTLASRITGLLRTFLVVAALGQSALGNAYNVANTLPNNVYDIAVGGILASVIVPLLVTAAKRDVDRGERYTQRMFTLVTVVLFVVTLAATLGAGAIGTLYGCTGSSCAPVPGHALLTAQHVSYQHALVILSYFFIPQIFFYGMSAIAAAVLNARDHFAAPMWTPVINNVVVIVVTLFYMVIAGVFSGTAPTASTITPFELQLLGVGTTLGIVLQTVALIPVLRRVGFRWHPRFDFRRADVTEIGRMGGWMFVYILATQFAFWVTVQVTVTVPQAIASHGYTAYQVAWSLFQMPFAIVAVSVITALLPRMSAHASDRAWHLLRGDFGSGVRLSAVILAPAGLILAALGPSLAEVGLAWGANSDADARYLGLVFSVFALGLVPYMLFQLLLRVFYSLHDSKTPALIGVVTTVLNIVVNLLALAVMPKAYVVASLGVGFGLANAIGTLIAWRILSHRLGGLGGRAIVTSLTRMHAAALPAAVFALIIALVIAGAGAGKVAAAGAVVVGGGGAVLIYLALARLMRVTEVTEVVAMVRTRIRP